MHPKTTPSKRKPTPATNNLEPARAAIARVARICPPTGRGVASTKKLPPYIIDSVEMDMRMESPTGKSPVQRARVTYVIDCMTANVMAATVHFEPCCDLASSGGDPAYNPAKHAAAEIQHFRSLFPGLACHA